MTHAEIDTAIAALLAQRARLGSGREAVVPTIKGMYGGRTRAELEANAPACWALGEFRQVRRGEAFLNAPAGGTVFVAHGGESGLWRIICTLKPPAGPLGWRGTLQRARQWRTRKRRSWL